ncbi:MAG: tryptophanase [Christensenellales bacterium]|jgi:tyrosine phenol-lyase
MAAIKFFDGRTIPVETHRVRIVQKLNLIPARQRLEALNKAGNNLYLLENSGIFMDMLTDSGVNAMSDRQLAAMMDADDAYAGSRSFTELKDKVAELFGMDYFLPAHQGRACENILSQVFVKPGSFVPMNYHFTTTRAHITINGGTVVEMICPEGEVSEGTAPFKGNIDVGKLEAFVKEHGAQRIAFMRMEAGANLIGGQPVSLENFRQATDICRRHGVLTVLDASLLQDNLYFIKVREPACRDMTVRAITRAVCDCFDIVYFSARKLGAARGGGIAIRTKALWDSMKELVTLNEGFLTYGGMSTREMGAITVGLEETMDMDVISQGPMFIEYMADQLIKRGVPVVTPAGGLGCHVDAGRFVPHIPGEQYPAAALASAVFLAGGIRTMERGTLSEVRNPDGTEHLATMELVRFAMPRRVFTMSQIDYVVDRLAWLYNQRDLIGGLRFVEEPKTLRFFVGRLETLGDWQEELVRRFERDFGLDN